MSNTKTFTCIICPNGCEVTASIAPDGSITACTGQLCLRGETYVKQELTDPRRNIATSVLVRGGDAPITSVRLSDVIPKARIFDVMAQINAQCINAPTTIGDVVIADVLGLGVDVIITKNVAAV
ncbi:MAG: DUF1667 domain-containing protein [Faecalibacterium sp.]